MLSFRSVPFLLPLVSFLISGCLLETPSTERKAIDCKVFEPTSCLYLKEYGKAGNSVLIKSDDYEKYGITSNTYPVRLQDGSSIENVCVNLQGDKYNCGECGNVCSGNCEGGKCKCINCGEKEKCSDKGECICMDGSKKITVFDSNEHCGECGKKCPGNSACRKTENGYQCLCDAATGNLVACSINNSIHCVDIINNKNYCGDCSTDCDKIYENKNVDGISCVRETDRSRCTYDKCKAGYADINDSKHDGCEVNTLTSIEHCGKKDNNCNNLVKNAEGIGCVEGKCSYKNCKKGFLDLDLDKDQSLGCEVNTLTSIEHCGKKDNNCNKSLLNASNISCNNGVCDYVKCNDGFLDGDGKKSTGCESEKGKSLYHCGEKGINCNKSLLNASNISCNDGVCDYKCKEGFVDLDGDRRNGCETKESDVKVEACGEAKKNCKKFFSNVMNAYCAMGKCVYDNCESGFADLSANYQTSLGCVRVQKWNVDKCGVGKVDCDEELKAVKGGKCYKRTYSDTGAVIGMCDFDSCKPYFYNMDNNRSNGCETFYTALINPKSCGPEKVNCFENFQNVAGAVYCAVKNAFVFSSGREEIVETATFTCAYDESAGCMPGFVNQDGQSWNGCEAAEQR